MTRADLNIATIGVAHAVYAIAGLKPPDLFEENTRKKNYKQHHCICIAIWTRTEICTSPHSTFFGGSG